MKKKQLNNAIKYNTKSGRDVETDERKTVLDGSVIFHMMDSEGIPFDILMDLMSDNNISFDTLGFVQAAFDSKNYRKDRLRLLFEYSPPDKDKYPNFMESVDICLDKVFG